LQKTDTLGRNESGIVLKQYAVAIETTLLAAAVGGTFLSFQYVEMLWHFFGISIAMEQIALITLNSQKSFLHSAEVEPDTTMMESKSA
jgi:hypothetical protein